MMFGLFFQYLKQILFFVYFWLDFLREKFFRETILFVDVEDKNYFWQRRMLCRRAKRKKRQGEKAWKLKAWFSLLVLVIHCVLAFSFHNYLLGFQFNILRFRSCGYTSSCEFRSCGQSNSLESLKSGQRFGLCNVCSFYFKMTKNSKSKKKVVQQKI